MSPVPKRRKLSSSDDESATQTTKALRNGITTAESNKPDQRRSLFVRSLPASVTSERLTEHFSQSFPLKHATVVLDPTTKISRGFGFVTFTDAEDTQAAVTQFHNSTLDGRKIKVEIAESRNREIEEDVTGARKETKNVKGEQLRAQRQKNVEENRPPKLIVRNLPWSIKTSDDLSKLFLSYGKVKHAVVPKAKGGQLAGFGFVVLRGKKNAEKALEGVNGKEVDGRTLAVDWAVDKESWEKLQNGDEDADNDGNLVAEKGAKKLDPLADDTSPDGDSEEEGTALEQDDEILSSDEEEAIMNGDHDEDESMSDISETDTKPEQNNTTVFIRNLPFTSDDESLKSHFHTTFGPVRYARVVYDPETERSRGTGFVCFFNESDAKECVKNAPKHEVFASTQTNGGKDDKKRKGEGLTHSLLQDEAADPSGKYTMEGRILQVSRALQKAEADKRMQESSMKRDHDKRRLYLLSEGTIPKGSKLYELLGKAEIDIRESSARQRQRMIKTSPNLGLSLTRLSIRNLPRSVGSKDLKALAREAVVGFSKEVREGKRQPISKEEANRGGDADREAEKYRKEKGKGIVKQVKIVFESENTGSKVGEGKGGRSRGYGFVEYYGHRNALAGLRWLNGHLVKGKVGDGPGSTGTERGKRLIVEFAIENAQVVQRRAERERRFREDGPRNKTEEGSGGGGDRNSNNNRRDKSRSSTDTNNTNNKRKRDNKEESQWNKSTKNKKAKKDDGGKSKIDGGKKEGTTTEEEEKNKIAMRNRVIAQKRQKRKNRKG